MLALMQDEPAKIGILEDDVYLQDYLAQIIERTPGLVLAFTAATLTDAHERFAYSSAEFSWPSLLGSSFRG